MSKNRPKRKPAPAEPWHQRHLPALIAGGMFLLLALLVAANH
ncbi:MAG: hypothetical protein R3B89_05415 [Polyangiaceae bacterium]